jgi:hypothetical protein
VELYSQIAKDHSISKAKRLRYAGAAAGISFDFGNLADARKYGIRSLELLPQVVSVSATRLEQLGFIRSYHQIPSMSTAFSSAAGDSAGSAISRLEPGRASLWDRLLIHTTLIEELALKHKDLAAELQAARAALARPGDP